MACGATRRGPALAWVSARDPVRIALASPIRSIADGDLLDRPDDRVAEADRLELVEQIGETGSGGVGAARVVTTLARVEHADADRPADLVSLPPHRVTGRVEVGDALPDGLVDGAEPGGAPGICPLRRQAEIRSPFDATRMGVRRAGGGSAGRPCSGSTSPRSRLAVERGRWMTSRSSSNRPTRWSNGMPKAAYSGSCQPQPSPRIVSPARQVVEGLPIFAMSPAFRNDEHITSAPSSTRWITPASAERVVQASCRPSSGSSGKRNSRWSKTPDRIGEADTLGAFEVDRLGERRGPTILEVAVGQGNRDADAHRRSLSRRVE